MGHHPASEGAIICREEGASLPLPKNDQENADFSYFGGGLIDATDLDEDGVWEDSYGNEVTYMASHVYYDSDSHLVGLYKYQYILPAFSSGNEFLWYIMPEDGTDPIICQIPLELPPAPSCEPPTTYNQLFESLSSVIENVDAEVSEWTPGRYKKRGIRAESWLRGILVSTQRFVDCLLFENNVFQATGPQVRSKTYDFTRKHSRINYDLGLQSRNQQWHFILQQIR